MARVESRSRERITAYSSALITAVASSVFLATVRFLPAPPVFPILVGVGLGTLSLRNRGLAIAALYILVYFSVLWQMIGFGFFQLLSAQVGLAVLLAMTLPLVSFLTKRVDLTSMALAVLAVSLMLTPAYFISIPLVAVAAVAFGGFVSLEALAATFVFFLTPFLLLENALYFTTTSGATAPIVFGQFSILAQNLRPPLPALNVLQTGIPSNYLSPLALQVSTWLAHSSGVLLIPAFVLGVILVAASFAGGVSRTLVERFERSKEITGRVKMLLGPLVVALVIPTVFVALLTLLSNPESGGFQTSLTNDPSHLQLVLMLGCSCLLTTSFVGRESLILRLESVQVGSEDLEDLIQMCLSKLRSSEQLLDTLSRRVPSMSLSGERQSMSEYRTYLADVGRQIYGASGGRIAQFRAQVEANVFDPLTQMPELLRRRVAGEIRGLVSASAIADNHLQEANVTLRYPDIPAVQDSDPLEDLLAAFDSASTAIQSVTQELSEIYAKERAALDATMGQQEVNPPVNAQALLDSSEFVAAMRLVAEEYWLNFHLRWAEPVDHKKSALLEGLMGLDNAVSEEERRRLESVEKVVEAARPSTSTATLAALRDLRGILEAVVIKASLGADRVGQMLDSLDLRSVRGLRFETVNRVGEIAGLKKMLDEVVATFDSLTKFIDEALGVLRSQSEAWKSDRENLLVLSQYPLARRVIERLMEEEKGTMTIEKLPFQKKIAALYAQLYATGNARVEYDDEREELKAREEVG